MQLQNKTIIVTGSATGIGRAIARYCVAEGARVLIHDRDEDGARAVADELAPHAACHIDDLLDPEAPARIVAAAVDAFGGLDALVNNAAAIIRSNIHSTSTDLFDRSIAVNVRAPLLLIQAALPHLEAAEGCVLNIGSINAYCGEESLLAYSISKGGLMTLTRNLGDALHFHTASASTRSTRAGSSQKTSTATRWKRASLPTGRSACPKTSTPRAA
jgi:NAD(P)-dependent dehydrogenase (short-subunit alcohol dehydrogenase family)